MAAPRRQRNNALPRSAPQANKAAIKESVTKCALSKRISNSCSKVAVVVDAADSGVVVAVVVASAVVEADEEGSAVAVAAAAADSAAAVAVVGSAEVTKAVARSQQTNFSASAQLALRDCHRGIVGS